MRSALYLAPLCVPLTAFALASCAKSPPPPATGVVPVAMSAPATAQPTGIATAHAVDLSAIDHSVKPGDDFFLFANGGWYAKAEIPPDRSGAGVWLRLSQQIEDRTKAL